ncbi:MAG: hypothetical protein IJ303_00445, partial [Clostridia bacterium]|nr:hypothetical protein [Clostridia bacterium]
MKLQRRILIICSAVFMLAALLAVAVAAETFTGDVMKEDSDNSNDLVWTFDDATGVLTITGTSPNLEFKPAASWNAFNKDTIPWFDHLSKITKVVIEAPITSICGYAFDWMKACTTVVIPNQSIKLMASMTFANMHALTTLGPEGTAEGTIDLRNFTGSANQAFENSCKDKTITVLMPNGKSPISTGKVFADSTVVVFKIVQGSAAEATVNTIKENSEKDPDVKSYTNSVTIEYYDKAAATPSINPDKPNVQPETPTQTIQETKTATAAYGTPVIDGSVDAAWDAAVAIDFPWDRTGASVTNLAKPMTYKDDSQKPYAKMLWDANKLYVLTVVPDESVQVAGVISSYNRDGVEVYIDELNEKKMTTADSSSYHQIQVVADGSFINKQGAEVEYAAKVND